MRRGTGLVGIAALALIAAPALGAPQVVTLGEGDPAADPVTLCGQLAASPFEDGWAGRGHSDAQIYLDGALAACEAAVKAAPDSAEAAAWLGRVYALVGRGADAEPLLERAAGAGNPLAAHVLAHLFHGTVDDGVEDNAEQAQALLRQAADAGFAPAESELAAQYEAGSEIGPDYSGALSLYQRAADKGEPVALYKVGYFYQNGLGTDQDYGKAMAFFQRAADAGEPRGWDGIGQLHQFGQGVEADSARAAEAYQHGADAGEPMSETALAYLYEQGQGVAQDFDRSFALLTDAVAQDYSFAQAALALHYLYGEGTPVDAAKAFPLASSAADKHVAYAEGILGFMFSEGLGTERDLDEALSHFQAGAAAGDQYSADRARVTETEIGCADQAGSQYENTSRSHGVDFDAIDADAAIAACEAAISANADSVGDKVWLGRAYARAERYDDALPLLQQGVDAGNALAQTTNADLLMQGLGVDEDRDAALELYRQAADAGFAPAQYALGVAYAQGQGLEADAGAARDWFRKAVEAGMAEAQDRLDELPDGSDPSSADLTGFGREGLAY